MESGVIVAAQVIEEIVNPIIWLNDQIATFSSAFELSRSDIDIALRDL
jgi:hypothetical protein